MARQRLTCNGGARDDVRALRCRHRRQKEHAVGALVGGVLGLIGAYLCIGFGRRWNERENIHTMYWIPLQIWGYIIIPIALFGLASGVVGFCHAPPSSLHTFRGKM